MGQQGLPKGDRDAQQPEGGLHGGCALSSCHCIPLSQGHGLGNEPGQLVGREHGRSAGPCSVLSADSEPTEGTMCPEEAAGKMHPFPFLPPSLALPHTCAHREHGRSTMEASTGLFQQACLDELGTAVR